MEIVQKLNVLEVAAWMACKKNGNAVCFIAMKNSMTVPQSKRKNGVTPAEWEREIRNPFLKRILKLAKPRSYWPEDYALNHAHYGKGHAKKS